MQFKQFFIALCALTLIFSACKKDEEPILADVVGTWKAITGTATDCDDPTAEGTMDLTQSSCTINPDNCIEYDYNFKADGTFTQDVTFIVLGQDAGEIEVGTYTAISENEIEMCYGSLNCLTASLDENDRLTLSAPDEETGCQMTFILERN